MATVNCHAALSEFNNGSPTLNLSNLPITLINYNTHVGIVGLTDDSGSCSFINVPIGNYYLIETAALIDGDDSPIDFSNATQFPHPVPSDPTLDTLDFPLKAASNRIQSITPNIFEVSIVDFDSEVSFSFLDGPVYDSSLQLYHDAEIGENLISAAELGSFGKNLYPIATDFSPPNNSFNDFTPNNPPKYGYEQFNSTDPTPGNVSLVNIINKYSIDKNWWCLSDHTSGDEIGNMLVVSSILDTPFFVTTIDVIKNSYYSFSAWVCRLDLNPAFQNPRINLKITDDYNNILVDRAISGPLTLNLVPTWQQIRYLPIKNTTSSKFKIELSSFSHFASGNNFAIDDISFKEIAKRPIKIPPNISFDKFVDKSTAKLGDILSYTLVYKNTGQSISQSNIIEDTIPNNTDFTTPIVHFSTNKGVVKEEDIEVTNPISIGFPLVLPGEVITLNYNVKIMSVPEDDDVISNSASASYSYINEWEEPFYPNVNSNTVETKLIKDIPSTDFLTLTTKVDKSIASIGNSLTYSITLTNNGDFSVNELALFNYLPSNLKLVKNSLIVNNKPIIGCPDISLLQFSSLSAKESIVVTFKAFIIAQSYLQITTFSRVTSQSSTLDISSNLCKTIISNLYC